MAMGRESLVKILFSVKLTSLVYKLAVFRELLRALY